MVNWMPVWSSEEPLTREDGESPAWRCRFPLSEWGCGKGEKRAFLQKEKGVRNRRHSQEAGEEGTAWCVGRYKRECGLPSLQVQTLRRRLDLFQVTVRKQ